MKHFYLILGLFSALFITSCTKEPIIDIPLPTPNDNVIVRTNITENTTRSKDTVYQLSGRIAVTNGATLTIQPGTIIKGEPGAGANASLLLITQDGRIDAQGTEEAPIIFTAMEDDLTPDDISVGVFVGTKLNSTIYGSWGGVVILGEAPISASTAEAQIEGIPTSDQNGLYGGNNPNDNSGILRYVSIRHGGANIGSGNEINGLTLGGVGSGTIIDNVEIVANQDDGVEFFGGTVNASNIVVWSVGDDAIDTDQGWSGTLDNFIVMSPQGHCLELDGPEGTLMASHTIKNGEVVAGTAESILNLDDNSRVDLENIYFTNLTPDQKINRVTFETGLVNFTNLILNVDPTTLLNYITGDSIPLGIQAGEVTQVNKSGLGWTWAPI